MPGTHAPTLDAVLDALFLPFASGQLRVPDDGRVLFLRARDNPHLREWAGAHWLCEQSFKPFADALARSGFTVGEADTAARYGLVMLLPPRQRDEARALFARAVQHAQVGGVVLACVPNVEGAHSAEADLAALLGNAGHLSKHKCRVFWGKVQPSSGDQERMASWLALDQPQMNEVGYISRPGLFAWDRVDNASALLAEHLPEGLQGRVADFGAGYGYLSTQIMARCPGVTAIDLYEAEARALQPARLNMERALHDSGRQWEFDVHWHDLEQPVGARYDAVVSNPPFHQGRADLPELGRAFITQAAKALVPHGCLWLVANRHLPYEATLAAHFNEVRTIIVRDGFKLFEAKGVRG